MNKNLAPILIDPSEERRILDFRPLGFRDVLILGHYRYAAVHPALEKHSHGAKVEICYLERGQQTYVVGQQRFDLIGGDVFLTFPNEPHGTGSAPEGKGALFWMILDVSAPQRRFLSLPPAMARRLIDSLLNVPSRHFPAGPSLGKTLHRICNAYDRRSDPLRNVELQNLLLRFLLDVLSASRKPLSTITPTINRVQDYIAQNIDRAFTVRQLAHYAGLSEPAFKARFKRETGIPPIDYVLRKKIDHARQVLQTTDRTITEVAMQLNFSTAQYFATVFRRYTGQSPTQFRRQPSTGD